MTRRAETEYPLMAAVAENGIDFCRDDGPLDFEVRRALAEIAALRVEVERLEIRNESQRVALDQRRTLKALHDFDWGSRR